MLSAADLLPYEYEDAVLLSNRIFVVTNQGTYFVWDTSYNILPLSQFICFESFRFISFKFKRSPSHVEITMSIKSLRACIVKKQISSLARVRAAVAPQDLAQELHFPLGAHGTELQWLSARPISQ